jgi:hypothetical protein
MKVFIVTFGDQAGGVDLVHVASTLDLAQRFLLNFMASDAFKDEKWERADGNEWWLLMDDGRKSSTYVDILEAEVDSEMPVQKAE